MEANTNTGAAASKIAWKTEITGRDAKSCTGRNNHGKLQTIRVGDTVGLTVHMDAADGGTLTGYRTAVVERIAVGTEYGMHGTTALVQLTVGIASYNEGDRHVLIAARFLEVV